MKRVKLISMGAAIAVLGLSGCSHKKMNDDSHSQRIAELEAKLSETDQTITDLKSENEALRTASTGGQSVVETKGSELYPPNAKAGECYARVLKPAVYDQISKQVLVKAAAERINVVPAQYTMVEQKVLVKEAEEVLKTVPAQFKYIEEEYVSEPERTEIVSVPATYKEVTEKVMVKPAYTTWKKGRGPIEKIDDSTGEIMCLVEVPAEYKTITQKVLDQAAHTKTNVIPAKYGKIKKKVLASPATVVKEIIPAEYKTIMVKQLVTPASESKEVIPAEYGTVTERNLVSEASLQWQSILCETNTTPQLVNDLQRALNASGYDAGNIDGVLGSQTLSALKKFQMDNGLASGSVTMEALKKLGVL